MKNQTFLFRTLLWVVLTSLAITSCKPTTSAPAPETASPPLNPTVAQILTEVSLRTIATPEPTTELPTPSGPKTATFIFTEEFDNLNPLYSSIWISQISQQIWNCWAWDFDDQNNPHPVLLEEIPSTENGGISSDGKVLTLKLRQDIAWSDGEPLTSADFLFTYQMAVHEKNSIAQDSPYRNIRSLETPDERTVVITFKDLYIPWMSTLWHGILPAHVLKPVFEAEGTIDNAPWNTSPTVGCGPFVFAEWKAGDFARFTANDKYWLGKPKLSEIIIRFVQDDDTQAQLLKSGAGDLGTFFPFRLIPELEAAGIQIRKVFSGFNELWFFYLDPQNGHPALQDVRVRQAIAMAFDRNTLTRDLLLGQTQPAISYWDNTPYIDPSLQPWPYDPEKAKKLLDQAGWKDTNGDGTRDKDGVELVLTYGTPTKKIRQDAQAIVKAQLAEVGITLDISYYDLDSFLLGFGQGGPAATGQLDIFQYSAKTTAFPDPDTLDFLCSEIPSLENPAGNNWSGVCDEELDRLFKLQATQVDFKARQQTFFQISKLIFEKVYVLGVWQDPDLWGINHRLLNVKFSGVTPFYNIFEWDAKS